MCQEHDLEVARCPVRMNRRSWARCSVTMTSAGDLLPEEELRSGNGCMQPKRPFEWEAVRRGRRGSFSGRRWLNGKMFAHNDLNSMEMDMVGACSRCSEDGVGSG